MKKLELEQAKKYIHEIDFTMVKFKLTHATLGSGWSIEKADRVEQQYKNYWLLILMNLLNSETLLPPTHDVDEFWHSHILDTQAYVRDCAAVFGRYLHHFPYFGMRGEQDAQHLKDTFKETSRIYHQMFGSRIQ